MTDLTVPDGFDEWPFEARQAVLAAENTTADLRREIDAIVGLSHDMRGDGNDLTFSKEEAAAIVMALGGPQEVDDAE